MARPQLETETKSPMWEAGTQFLEPSPLPPSIYMSGKLESGTEPSYSHMGGIGLNTSFQVIGYFAIEFQELLTFLGEINSLLDTQFANIFSHFIGCPLSLMILIFAIQMLNDFMSIRYVEIQKTAAVARGRDRKSRVFLWG